jgi:hypothetical protein
MTLVRVTAIVRGDPNPDLLQMREESNRGVVSVYRVGLQFYSEVKSRIGRNTADIN